MKSRVLFFVFLLVFAASLSAQIIHDPNGDIYRDIERWSVQGYIKIPIPSIRPYPAPVIDQILEDVIEYGNEAASDKAYKYRERLAPGSKFVNIGVFGHLQGKNSDKGLVGAPYVEGVFRLTDILSTSYNFTLLGMTDEGGERFNVPGTYSHYSDLISDTSNVGKIEIRQNWTSLTAIGTSSVYLQAGLSRTSVGPFFDNGLIVGPQAPRAGHFSFAFLRPMWSFEMLFQVITATDDFGMGHFPGKYNMFHNISVRPFENLELGFFQSMVYGGRIEPLYMVPFSFMFASESIFDFGDNAQMGLHLKWRIIDSLVFKGVAFVDDMHFNNLISSGSLEAKAAGQAGFTWAPKNGFLSKLDIDYTGVLPYCYTHWTQDDNDRYNGFTGYDPLDPYDPRNPGHQRRRPNYLNYTHMGRNLGAELEPNSDRISLRTLWGITPNIDIGICGYFKRHGNASVGNYKRDQAFHDGSIFDDGCSDPWVTTMFDPDDDRSRKQPYGFSYWLTQATLDSRLGGTIDVKWTVPFPLGIFKLVGEYGAEHGWNRNLINGNDGIDHYWSMGFVWSW